MASYLPPTDNLPIFDNQVFDSNNTTALTYATAKNLFVTFPSAQGTSTITDFIAGAISYLSPSSGSFFNIGTNQVSGGTIRIGPTGTSGVSVHAGNIDCTNNTINNATDAALNNVSLANLQTSGILNIGTGARTTAGAINIGTGSGAIVNPINIGGAGTTTTFANGLTLASSKYITTSHTGTITAPTSTTQIGYVVNGVSLTTSGPATSGNVSSIGRIDLTSGVWIVNSTRAYNNSNLTTRVLFSFGTALRTNDAFVSTDFLYGSVTPPLTAQTFYANLTATVTVTTATASVFLNIVSEFTTAAAYPTSNFVFTAVRIA